jgi:hypothetical protein
VGTAGGGLVWPRALSAHFIGPDAGFRTSLSGISGLGAQYMPSRGEMQLSASAFGSCVSGSLLNFRASFGERESGSAIFEAEPLFQNCSATIYVIISLQRAACSKNPVAESGNQ